MKKHLLFLSLFSILLSTHGQYGFLELPQIWLRSDSISEQEHRWRDMTENGYNARFSGETPVFTPHKLNYHQALRFSGSSPVTIPHYHFTSKDLTVIIVYAVRDSLNECGLWQAKRDSVKRLGLTTQHILAENLKIRYADSNKQGVVINTLTQHWKEMPYIGFVGDVQLGFGNEFEGAVAEFLLFEKRLSKEQVTGWASYLAVKYGVTLYDMPYLSSDSVMVWNNFKDYSFAVFGLGRDTKTGLHQRQSCGMEEKIVFGIDSPVLCNETHPETMTEGDYLIWGFDSLGLNNPQELVILDDISVTAYAGGLLQRTGAIASAYPIFLKIDVTQWQSPKEDYKLLIDRSGSGEFNVEYLDIYEPDSLISDSILYFGNIRWDTDGNGFDRFCFATLSNITTLRLTELSNGENLDNETNPNNSTNQQLNKSTTETFISPKGNRYQLYPNPNNGSYTVAVRLQKPASVEVTACTAEGKLLRKETGTNSASYQFSGFISTPGQYLIEVKSAGEGKVFKMVVQ